MDWPTRSPLGFFDRSALGFRNTLSDDIIACTHFRVTFADLGQTLCCRTTGSSSERIISLSADGTYDTDAFSGSGEYDCATGFLNRRTVITGDYRRYSDAACAIVDNSAIFDGGAFDELVVSVKYNLQPLVIHEVNAWTRVPAIGVSNRDRYIYRYLRTNDTEDRGLGVALDDNVACGTVDGTIIKLAGGGTATVELIP